MLISAHRLPLRVRERVKKAGRWTTQAPGGKRGCCESGTGKIEALNAVIRYLSSPFSTDSPCPRVKEWAQSEDVEEKNSRQTFHQLPAKQNVRRVVGGAHHLLSAA